MGIADPRSAEAQGITRCNQGGSDEVGEGNAPSIQ